MKKLVSLAAAGVMLAGGAVLSAPAASAYPAGADPTASLVGSSRPVAGVVTQVDVKNFGPGGCTATMKVTRDGGKKSRVADRTRTIANDGTATFSFVTPARPGTYVVKVKQNKTATCAGFSDTTKFRVAS